MLRAEHQCAVSSPWRLLGHSGGTLQSGFLKAKVWASHGAMHIHVLTEKNGGRIYPEVVHSSGLLGHIVVDLCGALCVQLQLILWEFDDILQENHILSQGTMLPTNFSASSSTL